MAVLYRHLKPNGEVFYIGIGNDIKRAYSVRGRNKFWKRVHAKYGYEVEILKCDLIWEDACELEKTLISWYGRADLGLGTLTNLTNGGDGQENPSEETRQKMRDAKKDIGGESHYFYGKPKTEEHKQKLREAKLGKKLSEEHIEKKKEAYFKYKETLPDKYICTKTLKTFKKIIDCAKYLNINYGTLRDYLDKNTKLKNTTTIVLYEDYLSGNYEEPHIARKTTRVINIDTGEVYESIQEAEKKNNFSEDFLRRNLKINKTNKTNFRIL
ncbi:MAG TPA: NUMOD3 domain-containing DNA-binding protein [Nitrosarchaeum sp.]|nr:NUMOD3 domain-containing DNA-binding protein [Nitrosarchaeum sp.]